MRLQIFFKQVILIFSMVSLLLVAMSIPVFANEKHDLQKAFFKEYTFLLKEKKALQKRFKEVKSKGVADRRAVKNEIDTLKQQVRVIELEAERINDYLITVEKETFAKEADKNVLEVTIEQANAMLSPQDSGRYSSLSQIMCKRPIFY